MAARPNARPERAPERARPGVIARALARIGSTLRWLLLSLVVSIVLECLGMVFWWPDEGLEHSRTMLRQEIAYLDRDFPVSIVSANPSRFAEGFAESVRELLFERSGLSSLHQSLSRPASRNGSWSANLRRLYRRPSPFVIAAVQTTQVFAVRLAVLCLATPVFLLFAIVGLVDGLVQRDLRRWGGGRESSYLYHYAKKSVWPFALMAWVSYLALPISVHPALIVLPFAALLGLTVALTASRFKKYL
ncbi:MAG: TIGR03747 family integrating conjugative element membrane protein [Woeseia sp.]